MDPKHIKILLLEDAAAHAEAIPRALESAGTHFQIQATGSLREYRESVTANPPDIALLDIVLPDGRSLELLASPPEANPFPALVMISPGDEQTAVEAMKAGALDYIVKSPQTLADLPHILTRALIHWKMLQERKRAEEALRQSVASLRALSDNLPNGMVYQVVIYPDGTRRFIYISAGCEKLHGVTEEAVLRDATLLYGQILEEDRSRLAEAEEYSLRNMTVFEVEARFRTPKGDVRWALLRSAPRRLPYGDGVLWDGIEIDITERKRAEDARSTVRRFHTILSQIPLGIIVVSDDERIEFVNNDLCRMFGLPDHPDQFIGLSSQAAVEKLLPAYADPEGTLARIRAVVAAGLPHLDDEVQTRDGRTLLIDFVPIAAGGKTLGRIWLHRDVTERKRAEAYREMGREILHILNEPGEMQDSIQRVLAALKTRTGFEAVGIRLQDGDDFPYFVQEGFSADFLLTENTLIERSVDGGVCRGKDGNISLECTCGQVISGKIDPTNPYFTQGGSCWTNDEASTPFTDTRLHPRDRCIHDGFQSVALVPIRNQNRIVGLIQFNDRRKGRFTIDSVERLEGIAAHIGAALMRKRADEVLQESKQRFQGLVETLYDWVWEVDRKGHYTYISPRLKAILGYEPEDIIGKTPFELMSTEEAQRVKGIVGPLMLQQKPIIALENINIHKDGHTVVLETNGLPFYDAHGNFVGYRGTDRDITERKRVEEAESRARELEEINRLRSAILASVSHELRTPLTLIMGISQSLLTFNNKLNNETRDSLRTIESESRTLAHVVENLEKMALLEAGLITMEKTPTSISKMIAGLRKRLDEMAKAHRLEIALEARMPAISIDRVYIGEVLTHLLSNAVAFSEKGSLVTIKAGMVNDEIVISVADQGIGIPSTHREKIFDRFYRVESGVANRRGGIGLGLSICKSIVEAHGGRIWMENKEGKGSTFFVALPLDAKGAGH